MDITKPYGFMLTVMMNRHIPDGTQAGHDPIDLFSALLIAGVSITVGFTVYKLLKKIFPKIFD